MNDCSKNTIDFYNELNNNCDINILQEIINCECDFSNPFLHNFFVPNEYIINSINNDNNNYDLFIKLFEKDYFYVLFFYVCYYKFIPFEIHHLFGYESIDIKSLVLIFCFNYFYLNNQYYKIEKLLKHIDRETLISYIVDMFGNNIDILEYVITNLVKGSLISNSHNFYNISPVLPLELIKKYNSKIFKPNKIYIKCPKINNPNYYSSQIKEDYDEIYSYFIDNISIFPFNYEEFYGYEKLEYIIFKECNTFVEKYLYNFDSLDKILNDPKYILNLIDEYSNNKIFILLIKLSYVISLLHNNYSSFIISLLVKRLGIRVYLKDKYLYFKYSNSDEFTIEKEIGSKFKTVAIIGNYIKCHNEGIHRTFYEW
ncbi:hypothetical protein BCR32DRAFT_249944 [Anaeromyces robustus]|uniref:Uncharacterized protein n=1 Tax=Anaeromyces robustus TaxID=1754192 RepID=A0A1Y1WIQ5_9FUNG|nr:hypothetical protein BCR32DRAFT_249944 [Anaeromyces robustus]|eukprot:ORX73461.1 hypothetical protein BCR32DRAFT_249944 [Anaeromyces robustus]